jgi:hypothetical protein
MLDSSPSSLVHRIRLWVLQYVVCTRLFYLIFLRIELSNYSIFDSRHLLLTCNRSSRDALLLFDLDPDITQFSSINSNSLSLGGLQQPFSCIPHQVELLPRLGDCSMILYLHFEGRFSRISLISDHFFSRRLSGF